MTHRVPLCVLLLLPLVLSAGCGGGRGGGPPGGPPPAPTVAGVAPPGGPMGGGTPVTVTGSNFVSGGTAVRFAGVPATGVVVGTATSLTCTTPAGAGIVGVTVETAGGAATLAAAFTYHPPPTVASVTPHAGILAGGTPVTLRGAGFQGNAAGTNAVTFGGAAAGGVVVVDDTTLLCATPAGLVGTVDVSVSNANGMGTLLQSYRYAVPLLYAADGAGATAGNLYTIDPTTGLVTATIGPIGFAVTGLAFAPDGTLYGLQADGPRLGGGGPALLTIHTGTGAGTPVGLLRSGLGAPVYVAAITFLGPRLLGINGLVTPTFALSPLEIDPASGIAAVVGGAFASAIDGVGNFTAGPDGTVYVLQNTASGPPEGRVFTVNTTTGAETAGPALSGFRTGLGWCATTYLNGTLYALDGGGDVAAGARILVRVDPATGVRTSIGSTGLASLDALAGTVP
jgi:hypothetical protein